MNERLSDFTLLRDFAQQRSQPAFAALAARHLDLVYATALRKVSDAGGAEEISQNVFSVLARKAWQFAPDDSLPAWLHKTTLLESKSWVRGELRRRRREQTAAELGTTMNNPQDQPVFHALLPLLDEALLLLREKDRTALLLRYYESHSLRDVGAAFGVSEDTAQKRVQNGLEKLAQFFKQRGFRTASVAAAAAALQHTAATASAMLVRTVVGTALQTAPPALVGLGALLARVASMTRVKTAAVCVALAALPLAWQLNAQQRAGQESRRSRAQLLAAQNQLAALQAQLERLRTMATRLEQSVAQANEAAAQAAESAQAFDVWKKKIRGQLTAAECKWDDDSPFARIPKSALPKLYKDYVGSPFSARGLVEPWAREIMGLSPSERQSLEELLHGHFAEVEGKLAVGIQETNNPLSGREVAAIAFSVPKPVEQEMKQIVEKTLREVRTFLGEERWPLVQATDSTSDGLTASLTQSAQLLSIWVEKDDHGALTMGYGLQGAICAGGTGALTMFLPESDPNKTEGADVFGRGLLSTPMRQRALVWLEDQAVARLSKGGRP